MNAVTDLSGRRILIVDDQPAMLDVLCATLEAARCTVLVAMSGQDAIRVARRSRPDLIVLDVGMPGMDGLDTCVRLMQHSVTRMIPVVFLSASDDADMAARCRAAGGIDFISKRLEWREIVDRIARHVQMTPQITPEQGAG
jgi:CheY-like chemotaxis protein